MIGCSLQGNQTESPISNRWTDFWMESSWNVTLGTFEKYESKCGGYDRTHSVSYVKPLQSSFQIKGKLQSFRIEVMASLVLNGIPIDADPSLWCPFLQILLSTELRNQTGVDEPVYDFMSWTILSRRFLSTFVGLDWADFAKLSRKGSLFYLFMGLYGVRNTVV